MNRYRDSKKPKSLVFNRTLAFFIFIDGTLVADYHYIRQLTCRDLNMIYSRYLDLNKLLKKS